MEQTKAIIFDFDGTLTDSREGITKTLLHTMEKMGQVPDLKGQEHTFIGPPLHDNMARLFGANRVEEALVHYRQYYVEERNGAKGSKLYDGVIEMLDLLKAAGFDLYIATSKYIIPTLDMVDHLGVRSYFKNIHGSLKDGSLSDKGELLASVLEKEGLEAEACVMIGDRRHDAIGAGKVGMKCIGALWGFGSREELQEAGVTACAETPHALAQLFC